jgi:DNA replication protein DnaC
MPICSCRQADIAAQRMSDLRKLANLDTLAHLTFDTFSTDGREGQTTEHDRDSLRTALEAAKLYATDPQGWLILLGGYGCGKTHLAAAIASYRVNQGLPALFVAVPDLLDFLRAGFSPQASEDYNER